MGLSLSLIIIPLIVESIELDDITYGRTSEITAFMVFTNESEFKKLLASVSQISQYQISQ
ncbi:hypothetical protein VN0250_13130 [Helicobacter pylori]